jgi:hypothetical protein
MSRLVPLSMACGDYDRTQALRTGEVTVEGADLTYLTLPVEETFFRMVSYREFDVAEMSLSTYVMTLALRVFLRHSYDQGLAAKPWEPEDLFAPEARQEFVI